MREKTYFTRDISGLETPNLNPTTFFDRVREKLGKFLTGESDKLQQEFWTKEQVALATETWERASQRLAELYGVIPVPFNQQNFHIVKRLDAQARIAPETGEFMFKDNYPPAQFRYLLIHELIHFYSKRKVMANRDSTFGITRVGLALRGEKPNTREHIFLTSTIGLNFLNEVVTDHLAENLMQELFPDEKEYEISYKGADTFVSTMIDVMTQVYKFAEKSGQVEKDPRLKRANLSSENEWGKTEKKIWELLTEAAFGNQLSLSKFTHLASFVYGKGAFKNLLLLSKNLDGDLREIFSKPDSQTYQEVSRLWKFIVTPRLDLQQQMQQSGIPYSPEEDWF